MNTKKCIALVTLCLLLSLVSGVAAETTQEDTVLKQISEQTSKVDKTKSAWRTSLTKPTVVNFTEGKTYVAVMKTNKGTIEIRLMPEVAPMHVTSFIYLAELNFYDDLKFHRVIPGFMAQGGCPLGTGSGGPGYKYSGEFSPDVKHTKGGLLSMANSGPGTDGSQFFLTFVPTPWLDGKHTIYGEITSGMDTMKALEAVGSRGGSTSEMVKIETVKIKVR